MGRSASLEQHARTVKPPPNVSALPAGQPPRALSALLLDDVARAAHHARNARAASTRHAYARAWDRFAAYALEQHTHALPADPLVVCAYLAHLDHEGLSPSTLELALASIAARHRAARCISPTEDARVGDVIAGIRATRGSRAKGKAPITADVLAAMVDLLPDSLLGLRDRALLLVGFAGAFRRSELVALHVHHVTWHREGMIVHVARSKTDQQGEGADVPIFAAPGPLCPVAALRAWLAGAGIQAGAIFRAVDSKGRVAGVGLSDRTVALIVKRAAARLGLDARELAGHSLRAGFATSAARVGANLAEIGRVTRHASEGQIRRYIRLGTAFDRDPLRGLLRGPV